MRFTPLGNRILVLPNEEEKTTMSGIIIPDSAKERPLGGKVVAISDEVEVKISLDDEVLFGKYAGSEMTLEGTKYLIMNVEDVLGIEKD